MIKTNLNLNKLNNNVFNYFLMPDGQPHIQLKELDIPIHKIICSIRNMNDLGKLLVTVSALRNVSDIELEIPYLMGARQDRYTGEGEPFTLKIITDIINNLKFKKVSVLHPHSDVTKALLNNFEELDYLDFLDDAIFDFKPDFLIIPDAGASKNIKDYIQFGLPIVQCIKTRDLKTGQLSGFKVVDEVKPGKGLIVDDICDGGGTFLGLAKLFDPAFFTLGLYTTHGIYSKGFKELNKVFNKLFCTNSYHTDAFPIEISDDSFKVKKYNI